MICYTLIFIDKINVRWEKDLFLIESIVRYSAAWATSIRIGSVNEFRKINHADRWIHLDEGSLEKREHKKPLLILVLFHTRRFAMFTIVNRQSKCIKNESKSTSNQQFFFPQAITGAHRETHTLMSK